MNLRMGSNSKKRGNEDTESYSIKRARNNEVSEKQRISENSDSN